MNKNSSEIEINGKKYDAATGQLLGVVRKTTSAIKSPSFSMDGIMRSPAISIRSAAAKAGTERAVHHLKRHAQDSKTLMRAVVRRPAAKKLRPTKLKLHNLGRSAERATRAAHVETHPKVKHFGLSAIRRHRAADARVYEGEIISPRVNTNGSMALAAPMPNVMGQSQRLERLLDYALAKADEHKKAADDKRRGLSRLFGRAPKWLSISAVGLILIGLVGLIVWQKLPQISLKLAASAVHVNAAMPSYTPEGYVLAGHPTAKNGSVMMTYKSLTDKTKTYTLIEQASAQNGPSGLMSPSSKAQVQTTQNRGVPISIIKDGGRNTAQCDNGDRQTILNNNAGLAPSDITNTLSTVC